MTISPHDPEHKDEFGPRCEMCERQLDDLELANDGLCEECASVKRRSEQ